MDEFSDEPNDEPPVIDDQRRKFNLTDKLAATLLTLTTIDPLTGKSIPVIDPKWAKTVTAKEIVAKFDQWHRWDHRNPLGITGSNHPSNIDPLPRYEHEAVKTPIDLVNIAKAKRIAGMQAEFRRKMLLKAGSETAEPAKKPRQKQAIKSPGFRGSRGFDGKVKWKEKEA